MLISGDDETNEIFSRISKLFVLFVDKSMGKTKQKKLNECMKHEIITLLVGAKKYDLIGVQEMCVRLVLQRVLVIKIFGIYFFAMFCVASSSSSHSALAHTHSPFTVYVFSGCVCVYLCAVIYLFCFGLY